VIRRELDGELVILDLDSGLYFGLDPVGTRIWQFVEEHGSLRVVWDRMRQEFDAPSDRLQSDLLAFVDALVAQGLVTIP
jgi:hypothetical protein